MITLKSTIIVGLFFFLGTIFLVPNVLYAAEGGYQLLAPIPIGAGNNVQNSVPVTGFASYAQNLITLIIGISAVLAVLMIMFGGFMYMTGEALHAKSEGKSYMMNAVYGLVLLLASYLILYTINPQLLNLNLVIPGVGGGVTQGGGNPNPGGPGIPGVPPGGIGSGKPCDSNSSGLCYSQEEAVVELIGGNVEWCSSGADGLFDDCFPDPYYSDRCYEKTNGCTSFDGILVSTVEGFEYFINQPQYSCGGLPGSPNCMILVTGATEPGHAGGDFSHSNGYKLDINMGNNPNFDAYIETTHLPQNYQSDTNYTVNIGEYIYIIRPECSTSACNSGHWDLTVIPDPN